MLIGADTETWLFEPGLMAPPMVCLALYDKVKAKVYDRETGRKILYAILEDQDVTTVWHNFPYDGCVIGQTDDGLLRLLIKACDEGRVKDTLIREKLIAIRHGTLKASFDEDGNKLRADYTLAAIAKKRLGVIMDKGGDTWRLRYKELDGIPIAQWPKAAIEYPKGDVIHTVGVHDHQEEECIAIGYPLVDEPAQVRAAFALNLMSVYGIRTDAKMIEELKVELIEHQGQLADVLRECRILRNTGARNMALIKEKVKLAYESTGREIPLTPAGKTATVRTDAHISTTRETLKESGDSQLSELAEYGTVEKTLKTFVPVLLRGSEYPLNADYDVLKETGRAGCSRPNMQNLPRKGRVRECFIARPGHWFCSVDFSSLELGTLAQVLLDLGFHSTMADDINSGRDPHLVMAASLLGCSFEEAYRRRKEDEVKNARQMGKVANFGLGAKMGADKLQLYAKNAYGIIMSLEEATHVRNTFFATRPEMMQYYAWVQDQIRTHGDGQTAIMEQIRVGRLRGDVYFTKYANGLFQGMGGDVAKRAMWYVTRECYTDPTSPLFGCRPVAFIHDEVINELMIEIAHEAAMRMAFVMRKAAKELCPGVNIGADPALMTRWYKGAEPVYSDGNRYEQSQFEGSRLIPWTPELGKMFAARAKEAA